MRSYAIYDEGLERLSAIGYLFYYEKAESFIIELCDDLDEWDAPLLFQGLVKKGIYTIPASISLMWVRERVIPSGRQNIGSIMKTHRMKKYNEMLFLNLSKGRCSQDNCFIEEVVEDEIPNCIRDRAFVNVLECFPTEDKQIVCMFKDDTVRKVDLSMLEETYRDISHVINNNDILNSVKVGVGGYSIVFNESIEIQAQDLRNTGVLIPLASKDFLNFVNRNVLDTTKTCDLLQCTRQNLSYMVREERLSPIKRGTKENLYLKGDIDRVRNEK